MKKSLLLFAGMFISISVFMASVSFAQTGSYSANVIYGNQLDFPIEGLQADLYDSDGVFIETDFTDANGFFTFDGLRIGEVYTAKFSYDEELNNVDLEDAYRLLLHLLEIDQLEGIQLLAADVDATSTVDFTDFMYILIDFYVNEFEFPAGDWVLPDWQFEMTTGKLSGGPAHVNRVGDLTDETPDKALDNIQLDYNDLISFTSPELVIPIYFNESIVTNGVGLVLAYNEELIDVIDIESPIEDLEYNIKDGVIRMGWTSFKDSYEFNSDEAIVNIHIKENVGLSDGQIEKFDILEGTHILNKSGKKYTYLNFSSSEFKLSESVSNSYETAYPNPCQDAFTLSINDISNNTADVQIYNSIGQLVKNETLTQNGQELQINTQDLENGIYIYLIKIQSKLIKGHISVQN